MDGRSIDPGSERQDPRRLIVHKRQRLHARQSRGFQHLVAVRQPRLGYADVLPYFKRYETKLGFRDEVYRGTRGELTVTDTDWTHPLCDAFIEGAVSIGIPRTSD